LLATPALDDFAWRIEHTHVREGGFAIITGVPGTGKSVALRVLAARLERLPDLTVAALTHPSANLADFYRELGDLFAVDLKPHNRWMGFKALRNRWLAHPDASLMRPALLIDEAQELAPAVLKELRLLASSQFDSRTLLSVVLAGDQRLTELLRRDDLLPLGSRIRARMTLEHASRDDLLACLQTSAFSKAVIHSLMEARWKISKADLLQAEKADPWTASLCQFESLAQLRFPPHLPDCAGPLSPSSGLLVYNILRICFRLKGRP
jgi:type II secretory pathway predicted ATPase ExeA